MSYIYSNEETGERRASEANQTYEEIIDLIKNLNVAKTTLIIDFPDGLGVDFEVQNDKKLWVEFHAKDISAAFIQPEIAQLIIQRAFMDKNPIVKERFRDLISVWEY